MDICSNNIHEMNPDQDYSYQMNIELLKKESDEADLLALRNKCLTNNPCQIFSMKYEFIQATQYPHIRKMVLNSIKFNWQDRSTTNDISKEMKEVKTIYCYPLLVSQSTALEKSDKEIIGQSNSEVLDFAENVTPKNNGTNSCAFISVGIIDNVLQLNSKSFVK